MAYEFSGGNRGIEQEMSEQSDNEVAQAVLGFENTSILASDGFLSVIKGTMSKLVETTYYYTEEDRASVRLVSDSLVEATPRLAVHASKVYEEGAQFGEVKKPTGEIEFNYSIVLDTPWSLENDPMGYQKCLGKKIVLDGTEFSISTGRVVVAPDGSYRYENTEIGEDPFYAVADPDGQEMKHPDPASLFPTFSAEQEAQLKAMALKTTDALIRAYGSEPDVLWDKTSGLWWDIKAPGARDMWKQSDNVFGLNNHRLE